MGVSQQWDPVVEDLHNRDLQKRYTTQDFNVQHLGFVGMRATRDSRRCYFLRLKASHVELEVWKVREQVTFGARLSRR